MQSLLSTTQAYSGLLFGTVLFAVALLVLARILQKRYLKSSPSMAIIKFGRRYRVKVPQQDGSVKEETLGFKPIMGGGTVLLPLLESFKILNLGQRSIDFGVRQMPTIDGVRVTVEAFAIVHFSNQMEHIIAAAQKFEDDTEQEINDTLEKTLSGQLRAILGKMGIEQLITERDELNKMVFQIAETEMLKLGIKIDVLTIQNISDEQGYIDALGKKRTAEVKRDAAIGEADALRQQQVQVAEAQKTGRQAQLGAEAEIADAERGLNKKKAEYAAEVAAAQAKSAQAGPLAEAEALKDVRLAQVAVERNETEARTDLAVKQAGLREKQLITEKVKPADADRQAAIIKADADKQKLIIETEAARERMVIDAEGKFAAAQKTADAIRIQAEADATATQRRGEGEAAANKARLLAEADGKKAALMAKADGDKAQLLAVAAGKEAELLAEGAGIRAKLLAEADGKEKLALALKQLDDTGRLLQVLDAAPRVAEAIGQALAKALGPEGMASVFGQMAAPLGNIDSIQIVDLGGGDGTGNTLQKLTSVAPKLVFDFLAQAQALGLDKALAKLGLDPSTLTSLLKGTGGPSTDAAKTT